MNQNNIQNQLLWKYQQSQQNNVPFQNNSLLQQNPMFRDNMNYSNSQQIQMMNMMQSQQMQRIKELQKIKQLEKLNELENRMDKEKIRDSVIKPLKIDKKDNMDDIIKNAKEKWGFAINKKRNNKNPYQDIDSQIMKNMDTQKKTLQMERTNLPYKSIIKNIKDGDQHYEKHYKKFVDQPLKGNADKKQIKRAEKELLVHKVTDADKDGVEEEFEDLQKNLETHNDELKMIYSTSKEAEHKKKFEYNHKSKYRIKYDPEDHEGMKKDKINILKKEQKKMEKDKQKVDDVIQFLVDDGLFGEDEIEKLSGNSKKKPTNNEPKNESSNKSNKSTKPVKKVNPVYPSKNTVKTIKPVTSKKENVKNVIKPVSSSKPMVKNVVKPVNSNKANTRSTPSRSNNSNNSNNGNNGNNNNGRSVNSTQSKVQSANPSNKGVIKPANPSNKGVIKPANPSNKGTIKPKNVVKPTQTQQRKPTGNKPRTVVNGRPVQRRPVNNTKKHIDL